MKFKARLLDLSANGHYVCLINTKEAEELGMNSQDRVSINKKGKSITASVDIVNTHHFIGKGEIGISREICSELTIKKSEKIEVKISEKPFSINYIKKRTKGKELNDSEVYTIISDIVSNKISSNEIAHLMSICHTSGLSKKEITFFANAFVNTGSVCKFDKYPLTNLRIIGNESPHIELAVASIISSAKIGYISLPTENYLDGHSESMLNSYGVNTVDENKANLILKKTNTLFSGEATNYISPAVKIIGDIEHPLNVYPDDYLVAASIARAKALSISHSIICIVYGRGRTIESLKEAKSMKRLFESNFKKNKLRCEILIFDGNFPLTKTIGSKLEAREIIELLRSDNYFTQLKDMVLKISGKCINKVKNKSGEKIAKEILESGHGFDQLKNIIRTHKGSMEKIRYNQNAYKFEVKCKKDGFISYANIDYIYKAAEISGVPDDLDAGIEIHRNRHERISKGEKLYTIYSSNEQKLERAKEFVKDKELIAIT